VRKLIESRTASKPRLLFFYAVFAALVVVLVSGLAYRQLFRTRLYSDRERLQNLRRVVVPGPRGTIYDRNGRVLVGNRPRFSVVLDLAALRGEFRDEYKRIRSNYHALDPAERPNAEQLERIARASVAQHYLDKVNFILNRNDAVRTAELSRHINQNLLLPYVLLDDLSPEEYARLIERLPVDSPLQVYTSSTRYYPFGSAAAHTLGYTGLNNDAEGDEIEGGDLLTFRMKSSAGRTGLEKIYDEELQGETGSAIYLVDPAGYKVNSPDQPHRLPVQGHNLTTSLDIDLQQAAEGAMENGEGKDRNGAAVALDVRTGEVLVLASKPDYDLNAFMPRLSSEAALKIESDGAWLNQAISGAYPPGSTFKLVTTIAGLRSGALVPDQIIADCTGRVMIGNRVFTCDNGLGHHGEEDLAHAIGDSCDIYFYEAGRLIGPELIAAEARRFHLDQRAGIELAGETTRMLIPDPAWKQRTQNDRWFPGDTANMAIGQGYTVVTPLQMACFAASLARNETTTKPTIIHHPQAPAQHTEPIGLTPAQRAALIEGMEGCTSYGTAKILSKPAFEIPGVRIAGKTGTAQKRVRQGDKVGTINCAWFICFAPAENPEIALAVMIEGDELGESLAGGIYAASVADVILKKYFEKKNAPAVPPVSFKVN
jgi:penicillin-binding protein 2